MSFIPMLVHGYSFIPSFLAPAFSPFFKSVTAIAKPHYMLLDMAACPEVDGGRRTRLNASHVNQHADSTKNECCTTLFKVTPASSCIRRM